MGKCLVFLLRQGVILMQVSSLLPILFNIILSEQQKQKQVPREQIANKTVPRSQSLSTDTVKAETGTPQGRMAEGGGPILLALPLKTPLFPDTQFFIFRKPDDADHKQRKVETGIVFSLTTVNLGQLFFMLNQRGDTAINIVCHTENEKVASRLTARAGELKQQVQDLGFEQITFHCTVMDHKLRKLQTELASPVLLDRKV